MAAQGVVVIGCGEFGAAAVSHLRERGAKAVLVTLAGKAATREQAAALFAPEELTAGMGRFAAPPLVALIGAADDAAGSGLLVAALRYLTERRVGRTRAVWLAMPAGGSRAQARAYATLLELEVLRANGAMSRCFLRAVKGQPLELAGMFGEAAVAYAQGHPGVGMYAGFGLGAVRDVAGEMVEQAAVLAARALVEQRGASPRAYQPVGFGEALLRAADELLQEAVPETWLEQRWMTANRAYLERHCLDEDYTGERLAGFLERHMQFQDQSYRASPTWVSDRIRALRHHVLAQARDFRAKCGRESEAACQELGEALGALRQEIEHGIGVHIKAQQSWLHEYETHRQHLTDEIARVRGRGVLPRRVGVDQRRGFLEAFEAIDMSGSSSVIATLRFQELRQLLAELEKEESLLAGAAAAARKEGEVRARLRDEVLRWGDAAVPTVPAVHLYPALPGAERVQRLADAVDRTLLIAALKGTQSPSAQAAALRNAAVVGARAALERMPELIPAAARERWLSVVAPGPEAGPVRICRVGEQLPADLRAELAERFGVTPVTVPGKWLQGDALVYCETDGVAMGSLQGLEVLRAAYAAQAAQQQGLHVLPPPAEGWPDLLPVPRPPRRHLDEAAATVVRACLLGLIGPSAEGGVTGRYLDEVAIRSVAWADLGEALRALAAEESVRVGLGAQAALWLGRLDEAQLAGYCALLAHFRQSAAVARLDSDVASAMTKAIEAELAGAGVQGTTVPVDAFSLPAGDWRYLKW